MIKSKELFLLFAIPVFLAAWLPAACHAITPAGISIESQAELYYGASIITSETTVTTVEQMYGITIEVPALSETDVSGITHYFPHSLTNLGNGSDQISFYFKVATPEDWGFSLIKDDSPPNGVHDPGETATLENPLPIGEEGLIRFFIAAAVPTGETPGTTGEAYLVATSEVSDGGFYIGANGTIYGGPDTAEADDILTVGGLVNPKINRGDITGEIYITWTGGTADILYISTTFDATFANATTEAYSATSPYYCSVEAKDGKIRYYKIKLSGRSDPEPQILGKFDVPVRVGMNELSYPVIQNANNPATLAGRQLTGASNAASADRIWKYNPTVAGSYEIAWLATTGKWYTGSSPTTVKIGTDEGFKAEIKTGHPATNLSMVGEVSSSGRTIEVIAGMNFAGSCFPVKVSLEATNLWQSGLTGASNAAAADRIWKFNPTVAGSYEIAWLATTGKWYIGSKLTTMEVVPGYGFWIDVRAGHSGFSWKYKKPY
jgi:hypothetical protein